MRCLACWKKVSPFSYRCPECGEVIWSNYFKRYWKLLIFVLMIIIIGIIYHFATPKGEDSIPMPPPPQEPTSALMHLPPAPLT